MKICWVRFVVTSLLILGIGTPLSFGQVGGPDPNNIPGWGIQDQEPTPEDIANEELLETQMNELNQAAAAKAAQGDLDGALGIYQQALQTKPNFTSALESARIHIDQRLTDHCTAAHSSEHSADNIRDALPYAFAVAFATSFRNLVDQCQRH